MLILIAGKIGSGKTTIGKELANTLSYSHCSFSDFLKKELAKAKIEATRENLQKIGVDYINNKIDYFAEQVLKDCNYCETKSVVIDGLRHMQMLNVMQNTIGSGNVLLIYVDADEPELLARVMARDGLCGIEVLRQSEDLTEKNHEELKAAADLVISGVGSLQEIVSRITSYLKN